MLDHAGGSARPGGPDGRLMIAEGYGEEHREPGRTQPEQAGLHAPRREGAQMKPWRPGDRVIHTGKPEWGIGAVETVAAATENGAACQRIRVRFDRAGSKILSTAYARLKPADATTEIETMQDFETQDNGGSWLTALEAKPVVDRLVEVPEPARDPFLPLQKRLQNALDLYRFRGEGGSLLDWATMQTQLKDPLSELSRHELEEYFRRFRHALDQHTADLAAEMKRSDPATLDRLVAAAPADAQQALRRNLARR